MWRSRRAQRLPASRRARPRGCSRCAPARAGAQRLPASRRARHQRVRQAGALIVSAQRLPASRRARLTGSGRNASAGRRCSTPSGITASATANSALLRRVQMSAQRLPASRRARPSTASSPRKAECAQRLPASRRARHGRLECRSGAVWRCSTPSGITASATGRSNLMYPENISAQRLPASRRARQHMWDNGGVDEKECSTPSGITASATEKPEARQVHRNVLNAFRHHGERDVGGTGHLLNHQQCSTPSGITASATSGKEITAKVEVVLNAFRHHGERDERPPRPACGSWRVLNAFRHHGERDSRIGVSCAYRGVCSTPSGITASATCDSSSTSAFRSVLNAFRHHGERDRIVYFLIDTTEEKCSTPSGITASATGSRKAG